MYNDYFQFFMCIFRKRSNISVALVSESYVLLYYEKKVYMLFINKICLNQTPLTHVLCLYLAFRDKVTLQLMCWAIGAVVNTTTDLFLALKSKWPLYLKIMFLRESVPLNLPFHWESLQIYIAVYFVIFEWMNLCLCLTKHQP